MVKNKNQDMETSMVAVNRTGRGANKKNIANYHNRYSELFSFACLIGDWRTATLCCRSTGEDTDAFPRMCPANPEPALPETIVKYMLWKTCLDGQVVLFQGVPVKDCGGNELVPCNQQWKAPVNVDKFLAAVTALHSIYPNLDGDYIEKCPVCFSLNSGSEGRPTIWKSCEDHPNSPLLKPKGNAIRSDIVRSEMEQVRNALAKVHIRKGTVRLLPGHLKIMCDHLFSKATDAGHCAGVYFVMIWTMCVVGTFLFLRASELLVLKLKDFDKKGIMVTGKHVQSVASKIEDGKNANAPVYLNLWRIDLMPWLCPVRCLLFYIDLAGLTCEEGYLFPTRAALMLIVSGLQPHSVKTPHMTYECWRTELSTLIKGLFPKLNDGLSTVGTHTLRYLGYLLAVWGILQNLLANQEKNQSKDKCQDPNRVAGDYVNCLPDLVFNEIMKCTRHASAKAAMYYVENCTCLFWAVQGLCEFERDLHKVPQWKMNYIGNNLEHLQRLSMYTVDRQQPISLMAGWFMEHDLGLSASREIRMQMEFHNFKACLTNQPAVEDQDGGGIMSLLATKLDVSTLAFVQAAVAAMLQSAKRAGFEEAEAMRKEDDEKKELAEAEIKHRKDDGAGDGRHNNKRRKDDDDSAMQVQVEVEEYSLADVEGLRAEWKGLDLKTKEARQKLLSICQKMKKVPRSVVKDNQGLDKWRQRALKWFDQFEKCVSLCHEGDMESFLSGEHVNKFTWTKPHCTCMKRT
jgi:hypothetical protein